MAQRRGFIILESGRWESVLEHLVDQEVLTWPPVLPLSTPGEAAKMLDSADFYRRHVVGEGEFYVFAKDSTLLPAR